MRVWAEDLPALFAEAAQGMNTLSGLEIEPGPSVMRTFQKEAVDAEGLLVAFLSELVYLQDHEQLGFDHFQIELDGNRLEAKMDGARLVGLSKPIKAVTFHNLQIQRTPDGYEVQIVFDV